MQQQQLDEFKQWFNAYVATCYGEDPYVNANLKLKEGHSRRTCKEMQYLVEELALSDSDKRIAQTIAIFHDIGRFKQFLKYRTYNDTKSTNHCLLGVEFLRNTKVLDPLDQHETQLIEKAIEYHGIKQLPALLDDRTGLFCNLIRDADKLDIFYTAIRYYSDYEADPQGYRLELEFPNDPTCSPKVVQAILTEKLIDYADLRTWNDAKLLQLGWVYNVCFPATLKRIKQQGYLQKLIGFLTQTDDTEKVAKKILDYVDSRIEQNR